MVTFSGAAVVSPLWQGFPQGFPQQAGGGVTPGDTADVIVMACQNSINFYRERQHGQSLHHAFLLRLRLPQVWPAYPILLSKMIDAPLRLRRAIHANDALLVRRIIRSHPKLLHNPDTTPEGLSNSNLHLAASLGHLSIVKLLISLGHEADLPALNDDFQTALMLASAAGHTEIVHFLSEQDRVSIMRRDIRGRDAIMEASRGGHDTVLQILLTYVPCGPEQAVRNADVEGNTALHFASSNGNLLVLRTLLAAGADAERRNIWSWTAVAYSATVEAEVYLKRLVAEAEAKRKMRAQADEVRKQEVLKGGLRIVAGDND